MTNHNYRLVFLASKENRENCYIVTAFDKYRTQLAAPPRPEIIQVGCRNLVKPLHALGVLEDEGGIILKGFTFALAMHRILILPDIPLIPCQVPVTDIRPFYNLIHQNKIVLRENTASLFLQNYVQLLHNKIR